MNVSMLVEDKTEERLRLVINTTFYITATNMNFLDVLLYRF